MASSWNGGYPFRRFFVVPYRTMLRYRPSRTLLVSIPTFWFWTVLECTKLGRDVAPAQVQICGTTVSAWNTKSSNRTINLGKSSCPSSPPSCDRYALYHKFHICANDSYLMFNPPSNLAVCVCVCARATMNETNEKKQKKQEVTVRVRGVSATR